MSTAPEIFKQFIDALQHLDTAPERWLALFADDAVFEFPYRPTLGMKAKFQGKEQIRDLVELVRAKIPPFRVSNVLIHELKNEDELFVEYHADARIVGTDKIYAQDYASFFVIQDGKIKHVREYLNLIASARATLPGGLASVPNEQ